MKFFGIGAIALLMMLNQETYQNFVHSEVKIQKHDKDCSKKLDRDHHDSKKFSREHHDSKRFDRDFDTKKFFKEHDKD